MLKDDGVKPGGGGRGFEKSAGAAGGAVRNVDSEAEDIENSDIDEEGEESEFEPFNGRCIFRAYKKEDEGSSKQN